MNQHEIVQHEVDAYNLSVSSENKIHDDNIAKQLGFHGGLVPGVEVYAYMINPVVQYFGPNWLENGQAECKFLKPVYDGFKAKATASITDKGSLALKVESQGILCARGIASLAQEQIQIASDHYPLAPLPDFENRPQAEPKLFPKGLVLGTFVQDMVVEEQQQYLSDAQETLEIYSKEKLVHPGWILRLANRALTMNVRLGPWIHVGSRITNFKTAHYGDRLSARARVADAYEHKGHLFIDIDLLITCNDRTPITHIFHTSIYRPRQVTEAA